MFLLFVLVFSSALSLTIPNAACSDPRTMSVDLTIRSSSLTNTNSFTPGQVKSALNSHENPSYNDNASDNAGGRLLRPLQSMILKSLYSQNLNKNLSINRHLESTVRTRDSENISGIVNKIPHHPPSLVTSLSPFLFSSTPTAPSILHSHPQADAVYKFHPEGRQSHQSQNRRLLLQEVQVQDGQKKITNLINDGDDDSWVPGVAAAVIVLIVMGISLFACCIHCTPCCNHDPQRIV